MQLQSTLTCPQCGHVKAEEMPEDYCLVLYECAKCGSAIRPEPGDCCVFCSFADVRCPSKQATA